MADWALPVLTSLYTDVLTILKARDDDNAQMLFGVAATNIPLNTLRYERTVAAFQEWLGPVSGWQNKILGLVGGGTGATNATDARTNLGLGSMAVQNSNNVSITGGTITGISSFGVSGNITVGNITASGVITGNGSGITNLNAANLTGIIPAASLPDPLPARNAGNLYNLNPTTLNSGYGIAPQAALGGGAYSSATFLRGDGQWTLPPSAGGLPAGAVIMFTGPCPPGFTHVAGWNGYYVRMGGAHVAGGANTHQHGVGSYAAPAHTHPAGTLNTPSHNHGGATGSVSISVSGTTSSSGGHSHGYSGTITGTTGGENNGSMNCDAGGSGTMARSGHGHGFSANYSDETNSVANHTHTFSGSGSGTGSISSQGSMGINGSTASAGGGAITGASDVQNNMPLYIDFFACIKD